MYTVLILCRSATIAQQAARQLARQGCPAAVVRPPLDLTENGCSYALSLSGQFLPRIRPLLHTPSLACSGKVFRSSGGGWEPLEL